LGAQQNALRKERQPARNPAGAHFRLPWWGRRLRPAPLSARPGQTSGLFGALDSWGNAKCKKLRALISRSRLASRPSLRRAPWVHSTGLRKCLTNGDEGFHWLPLALK